MNNIYLNQLNNMGMHSYGMLAANSAIFLPKGAFLTECNTNNAFNEGIAGQVRNDGGGTELQNELLNFEREHGKR